MLKKGVIQALVKLINAQTINYYKVVTKNEKNAIKFAFCRDDGFF